MLPTPPSYRLPLSQSLIHSPPQPHCRTRVKTARLVRRLRARSERSVDCLAGKPRRIFHERVLIVEDDAAARVGLEQLIRSWGFAVETAGDGDEALEKVTAFRPGSS